MHEHRSQTLCEPLLWGSRGGQVVWLHSIINERNVSEGLVGDLLMSLIYYTVHISLGILGVSDGHRIFVA